MNPYLAFLFFANDASSTASPDWSWCLQVSEPSSPWSYRSKGKQKKKNVISCFISLSPRNSQSCIILHCLIRSHVDNMFLTASQVMKEYLGTPWKQNYLAAFHLMSFWSHLFMSLQPRRWLWNHHLHASTTLCPHPSRDLEDLLPLCSRINHDSDGFVFPRIFRFN